MANPSCYRMAVQNSQGRGMTKYTGDNWVWPVAYVGARKAYTTDNVAVSIVCNNRNGKFYQIGVPELWVDRQNDYGTGYDIQSKIKLKERVAIAGEYEEIEHVESHLHIRPYKEENRDAFGYNSDGFLINHSIDVQVYENGEPTTPSATLEDITRYGDLIFRKRIEARRLQLEYFFAAGGWRIIKTQELYMPINKAAGPVFDYPVESQWQYEFRGAVLWISRDRIRPILNRATGVNMSGNYDILAIGPDAQDNSAISMDAGHNLSTTLSNLTGNFTVSFWLANMAAFPGTILSCATGSLSITISLVAGYNYVNFADGINSFTKKLTWTSLWDHIVIQRSGANIKIFENGVSIYTSAMTNSGITYGGATRVSDGAIVSIFDFRIIPRAVSAAAIAYYYDEIINNGKSTAFLPINR